MSADLLTMASLREGLQRHIKETGVASSLKTQLRTIVLNEITQSAKNASNKPAADTKGLPEANPWLATVSDRLVEAHLRHTSRTYSQSIFASESGAENVSDAELRAAVNIPQRSTVSPLVELVTRVLRARGDHSREMSIQTDDSAVLAGDMNLSMERKLALVDAQYAIRFSQCESMSRATMEERLKMHRTELEAELRREYEHRINAIRGTEIAAVRRDEQERYQLLSKRKQEEMIEFERTVQFRMEQERSRLESVKHDLECHRLAMDKRSREALALVEERERAVGQLERQISDQRATITKLQTHLTQLEELAATRLQEAESWRMREARRAEDIRRLQAEHAAELRARDDENAELRYRIKVTGEEYRNHMDRMSLDMRMAFQGQPARHTDPAPVSELPAVAIPRRAPADPPTQTSQYKTLLSQAIPSKETQETRRQAPAEQLPVAVQQERTKKETPPPKVLTIDNATIVTHEGTAPAQAKTKHEPVQTIRTEPVTPQRGDMSSAITHASPSPIQQRETRSSSSEGSKPRTKSPLPFHPRREQPRSPVQSRTPSTTDSTTPQRTPSIATTTSSATSERRRPVLDLQRQKENENRLKNIRAQMESVFETEISLRGGILTTEFNDRLSVIAKALPAAVSGVVATAEDQARSGIAWTYRSALDRLKAQMATTSNAVSGAPTTMIYADNGIMTRDSDSDEDMGLFNKRGSDDSDF